MIEPAFGPGSFERHRERARSSARRVEVLRPPSLLLDIDTPDDLDAPCRARTGPRRARARPASSSRRDGGAQALAIGGLPEIAPGDDLAALILEAGDEPTDDEIVVVAQKVVSKAEGQLRELAAITPSARARELAAAARQGPATRAGDPR